MKKVIEIIAVLIIVFVSGFFVGKIYTTHQYENQQPTTNSEEQINTIEVSNTTNTTENEIKSVDANNNQIDNKLENNSLKIVNESEISSYQTTNRNCKATYYLKVNYGQNVVTVYTKDAEGNYIVPFKPMICSCGSATPKSGTYRTSKGYAWGTVVGGLYAQYSTRIKGNILFHSIPYKKESKDTMEYWEYDKLGTTASAGCVRLRVEDCKWIFDNCEDGTIVEFYTSTNPGPFGKPTIEPISNNIECRNWDPTDDVPENPWKKYN